MCNILLCALIFLLRFFFVARRGQSRKDAFDSRKRELKALGLGQDGRPIKKPDEGKEKKSRGKVSAAFIHLCHQVLNICRGVAGTAWSDSQRKFEQGLMAGVAAKSNAWV